MYVSMEVAPVVVKAMVFCWIHSGILLLFLALAALSSVVLILKSCFQEGFGIHRSSYTKTLEQRHDKEH